MLLLKATFGGRFWYDICVLKVELIFQWTSFTNYVSHALITVGQYTNIKIHKERLNLVKFYEDKLMWILILLLISKNMRLEVSSMKIS